MLSLDEELEGAVDRLVVMALEAGVRGTRAGAVRWGVLEMARSNGPPLGTAPGLLEIAKRTDPALLEMAKGPAGRKGRAGS